MLTRTISRATIAYAHDIVMAGAAFVVSIYLRVGDVLFYPAEVMVQGTITFMVIAAIIFRLMGLYRGVWRYASLNDLMAITRAVTLIILVFLAVMFAWTRLDWLPRSLPFINWFVLMALLGGPRFLYRLYRDGRIELRREAQGLQRVPVLLVGSGDGAELFIRAVSRQRNGVYRVVGIVAERNITRVGRIIHGIEVIGTTDELGAVVDGLTRRGLRPQRLVLTDERMDGARVRHLLDEAHTLGMTLARIPSLTDFKAGIEDKVEIKPVAVEDLLGRPQMPLDREAMRTLIAGRRVLVTGAGGSIGSELVRQVCGFGPAEVVLLDSSEYQLYQIDLEVGETHPGVVRRAVIADVRDRARLDFLMAAARPELVFHAAALKHVPLVEINPFEGLMTNVIGTANVAEACRTAGVAVMVLISSDKAVNPTNVMGASKRIAEQVCQSLDLRREAGGTRFVTVRFGNVLGSTGSVVPLFQRQLANGGPLTITHPEMTRYFMTIREAVELVLEASALGAARREYAGRIFVLEMGQPVKILDLARQMIRLAGLRPDVDVKIETVGLRPGEKLYEELFHSGEALVATEYAGVLEAAPRTADAEEIRRAVKTLAEACADADAEALGAVVRALVPEYRGPALSEEGAAPAARSVPCDQQEQPGGVPCRARSAAP